MLEGRSEGAALLPQPNQYHDTYVPSLDALGSASITVARTLGTRREVPEVQKQFGQQKSAGAELLEMVVFVLLRKQGSKM